MDQFLTGLEPGLVIICGLLCVGLVVIFVVFQLIGGILGALGNIFQLLLSFLTGGPETWCSCIVGVIILTLCCGITVTIVSVLSTCNTADAVNFCRLF